jgi:hypothetical protein
MTTTTYWSNARTGGWGHCDPISSLKAEFTWAAVDIGSVFSVKLTQQC